MQAIENISRYYTKIIKMTLVTLMSTLNIFLSAAVILKAAMQNNALNLGDFHGKYL